MPGYARRARLSLLATVLALAITAATAWSRLPGSVALVWTVAGHPRGQVPRTTAFVLLLAVPLVFAAITAGAARLNLMSLMRAGFSSVGVLVTVLVALRAVFTLAVNAGYGSAAPVPVAVAVLASVVLVVIALLAALHVIRAPAGGAGPPQWRAGRGEPPLWRGTAMARRPTITCLVFFVIGLGAVCIATDVFGVIFALGGVVGGAFILSLTAIVVEVDHAELRVRYFGGAGWPVTRIPTGTITDVQVVNVNPPKSGGWGYRGSLRMQGAAAVNICRGPGLRLHLEGGKRFLVTVDNAEGGAVALRQVVTTS